MDDNDEMMQSLETGARSPILPARDVYRGRSKTRAPQQRTLRTPPRIVRRSRSRSRSSVSRSLRNAEQARDYNAGRPASSRRSRSRDKRHRPSVQPSREDPTYEFMSQFKKFMNSLSTPNNNCKEIFSTTNVIPEFDPSLKNQSINNWLTKVNECGVLYGWTERQIIHYALPKLIGVAKKWYEGLPSLLFTWEEWQTKLRSAFPSEENYGQMLTDMLAKRAKFGESLEEYFYEKVALLNRCNILGKRAVECILHGIDDRSVRLGAEAAQFSDADRLLAYLRNVKIGTYRI